MRYETAEISLIGDRSQNQDRVAVVKHEDCAFLLVVDGMGGHAEGERAAEVARQSFIRTFDGTGGHLEDPADFLAVAITQAHEAVSEIGDGLSVENKPRATCAICLVLGSNVWWAHVGDARVYLLRDGRVMERTRDHSHVELLLREGLISEEEITNHPMRHYVECCLGGESALPGSSGDASRKALGPGDTVLVCSDGLWSGLPDDVIGETCRAMGTVSEWLEVIAESAVTNNSPHSDNTTAAALRFLDE